MAPKPEFMLRRAGAAAELCQNSCVSLHVTRLILETPASVFVCFLGLFFCLVCCVYVVCFYDVLYGPIFESEIKIDRRHSH